MLYILIFHLFLVIGFDPTVGLAAENVLVGALSFDYCELLPTAEA